MEFQLRNAVDLSAAIERRLAAEPGGVLIEDGDQLTNRWIWETTGHLLNGLRKFGVGPGSIVAIDSSLASQFPVALVAVIRARCAYVAFDFRDLSLLDMVRGQVSPSVWICGEDAVVPAGQPALVVGRVYGDASAFPDSALYSRPDDPFQVVFTSGTTGTPKFVLNTYGGVANRLAWFLDNYPTGEDDRVVFHKSPSLVGSPVEILTGILGGGKLLWVDRETVLDRDLFWARLMSGLATHFFASPPILELLLESASGGSDPGKLRIIGSSAQALPATLARECLSRFPGATLLNMYGLSECSSNITCFELADVNDVGSYSVVPVGLPIRGCEVTIVRNDGDLVDGEVGEIVVTGTCVALGYLGEPAGSEGRFVRLHGDAELRTFRTGDMGRRDTDGNLELVGRSDTQVKIRGYKVFPEEVEAAILEADPSLLMAGVSAIGEATQASGLIALVLGRDAVDISALQKKLSTRLPEHMRPDRVIPVAELPLSESGKVDRRRLAELVLGHIPASVTDGSGADSIEQLVGSVWAEVLERPSVGLTDRFFDIGGQSLKATRAISRLRKETGAKIPLRLIFENPALGDFSRELAAYLRTQNT